MKIRYATEACTATNAAADTKIAKPTEYPVLKRQRGRFMTRYLFIAALAFAGGYAWGAADGFTYAMRVLPLSTQFSAQ